MICKNFIQLGIEEIYFFLNTQHATLLNLSSEIKTFLLNIGLPKKVDSLRMYFDLDKIEIYTSSFDSINNVNLDNVEKLYQIGYSDMFGDGIAIQESNGSIYITFSYGQPQDKPIERSSYFNKNIRCFANCLNTYEEFSRKYPLSVAENLDAEEKYNLFKELRESLRSLDETIIICSQSEEIESDDFWSSLLLEWYRNLDLYPDDEYLDFDSEEWEFSL